MIRWILWSLPLPVFLQSAVRTPYGAFGGAFRRLGPVQLAVWAIHEALAWKEASPRKVDAFVLGQSLRYGGGTDPGRQTARAAGIDGPAWVVDQGKASGLRALISGLHAIEAGAYAQVLVAAADSASTVPYLLPAGRWGHRLGQATAMDPLLLDAPEREEGFQNAMARGLTGLGGPSDQLITWPARSRDKALACVPGCFPVTIPGRKGNVHVETDEYLKAPPPEPEAGWPLPPLADGAAALVLSSEGPGMHVVGCHESSADHPTEALLRAVRAVLQEAGLSPRELDWVEVDESLLLSPLSLIKDLQGLDPCRLNPAGGAFATGQAHATEGLRILVTLAHGLERQGGRFGLAAMETPNGQGFAILLERIPS
jgi:acetyl-CoA C-acetyltransferase